ncbi:MAG: hypothetical protein QOE33_1997 [Acidobacteriota bacterium]|nr:hypothetical protein [Acidobacteriota bacterium]
MKRAGYTLDAADITVVGLLKHDDAGRWLVAEPTGQRFALVDADKLLAGDWSNTRVELTGDWKTVGEGDAARETITPRDLKRADDAKKSARAEANDDTVIRQSDAHELHEASGATFTNASFDASTQSWLAVPLADSLSTEPTVTLAPIRTTTPGLTVFKGGALTPRLYLIEQHLGALRVSRQVLDLSVTYTPSPRVQLEVEAPIVSRTSFDDGAKHGDGVGIGNVTLWGKYRFFRAVKTYGDRQAAFRIGLELPTGKKDAPTADDVSAPAFVRQQLTPISGGFASHFDLAFSQAGGRFIFGGNVEGVLRTERAGFRTGHEARAGTDLEYVLLPFDYERPGHELFLILETSFVHRGTGHLGSAEVAGSRSTEFYVAPGLQYAAHPRFVVEASVQLPVVRNTGPLVLRTDRNILLGVKYLF